MASAKDKSGDLRETCIREALAIIEAEGVESLSLREVARRLGVSHQAPYKHFPSRDHILAEIVRRAFESFADYLDEQAGTGAGEHDMEGMGRAYLLYALTHPLQYRLMFSTPLPDPALHPAMMASARHAFDLLRASATQMPGAQQPDLDSLFIWSTMHGLASILQSPALHTLGLPADVLGTATDHTLGRIGRAMGIPPDEAD